MSSTPNPNHVPAVPAAVRAAAAAADEALQRQAKLRKGENPDEPAAEAPKQEAAPEAPKAEEAPPQPTNPDPRHQEAQPPQPTHPEPPRVDPQLEKLQNDVKAQEGRVRTLLNENDNLRRLLATMQTAPPAPAAPPAPREMHFQNLIKPEEREEYGEQFLDMVGRRAQEVAGQQISELQAKIQELEGKVQGATNYVQSNADQSFWRELEAGAPNWRDINVDERWKEWLGQVDPFSGRTRQSLLDEAQEQRDAKRVVAFLQGFQREAAVTAPPTPAATPPAQPGKVSLEQYAAPGRPSAGSTPNGPAADKRIISRAEVAQFYADKNAGRYRGREQEAAAAEAAIFQAGAEGRIQ